MLSVASTSDDFLASVLQQLQLPELPVPYLPTEVVQNSPLLQLPDKVLDLIVSFIPLRSRILEVGSVCRSIRNSVKRSITSISFYNDQLDILSDKQLGYLIKCYGENISSLNFDLFRSANQSCSQWPWRQAIVSLINIVPQLKELNVTICSRHRLRDVDLVQIIRSASTLQTLKIDAHYIRGYCLLSAVSKIGNKLKHLELEMCSRILRESLMVLPKFTKLETLHISQPNALDDRIVIAISQRLKKLKQLSIVSHPDTVYPGLTANSLARLAELPNLEMLCLEGIPAVTDRFLQDFSAASPKHLNKLRSLSLSFNNNFGSSGLASLAKLPVLENLNLDGVAKRDISAGLMEVASQGRLVRLLLSGAAVGAELLMEVIRMSTKLRLLDITSNSRLVSPHFYASIVSIWRHESRRPILTILTDDYSVWNNCGPPSPVVIVVDVCNNTAHKREMKRSALSSIEPHQLPPGLLCPDLRKGNRYRILWANTGSTLAEDGEAMSLFDANQVQESKAPPCTSQTTVVVPPLMPNEMLPQLVIPPYGYPFMAPDFVGDFANMNLSPNEINMMMTEIAQQMALMRSMLSPNDTHQYFPGTENINPMLGMAPTSGPSEFPHSSSGLAPAPPVTLPDIPRVIHTRSKKRRSRGEKLTSVDSNSKQKGKNQKHVEPNFVESDFPPLAS